MDGWVLKPVLLYYFIGLCKRRLKRDSVDNDNAFGAGTWDMIRGKIEAVTGRSKSKDKQNKVLYSLLSCLYL